MARKTGEWGERRLPNGAGTKLTSPDSGTNVTFIDGRVRVVTDTLDITVSGVTPIVRTVGREVLVRVSSRRGRTRLIVDTEGNVNLTHSSQDKPVRRRYPEAVRGLPFGLTFRHYREELGLSLRRVAKTVGMNPGSLHKIEKGFRPPPNPKLLMDALGLPEDDKRRAVLAAKYEEMPKGRTVRDPRLRNL